MASAQVAVVGAGPAGISAALALKDAGVRPLVVDRAERAASSWRGRYDRLRLNTCRLFSHLPDRKFPKGTPMSPSRDHQVPVDRFVYRLTHGRTTLSSLLSGLPVVMLTTTGARTGAARTQPVLGIPDGDAVVVIASNYGRRHTPAWCHNLRVDPHAFVTMQGTTRPVVAHELEDPEHERWFRRGIELYPPFEQYRRRASPRRIPILRLEPAERRPVLRAG